LAIVHAKDRRLEGGVCPLGRGIVDFEEFFGLLHSAGFRGPVIMHGFEEAQAAESTTFARAKLEKTRTDSENASI
jgi:sugar phosphate isomerase/epimerase